MSKKLICIGVVSEPYHLNGLVKISFFTEDPKAISRLRCQKLDGSPMVIKFIKSDKKKIICKIDSITSRTDAENILGTKIYVQRCDLPELGDAEFYIEDLVGLDVRDVDEKSIGKVKACYNFGAGDIIEIEFVDAERSIKMHHFSKEIFPEITKEYIRFIEPESSE
jgi:16S rRNA processing protein RimM